MELFTNTLTSFVVVITGFCVGYLLYKYVINKKILEPLCLTNSSNCVTFDYWNYKNSILFNLTPNGYWCWFNGQDLYLYNTITNTSTCHEVDVCDGSGDCVKTEFSSAFKIPKDPTIYNSGSTYENVCIESVDELIKYYESLNVRKKVIKYRVPKKLITQTGYSVNGYLSPVNKLDVYDCINFFVNKNIISIA